MEREGGVHDRSSSTRSCFMQSTSSLLLSLYHPSTSIYNNFRSTRYRSRSVIERVINLLGTIFPDLSVFFSLVILRLPPRREWAPANDTCFVGPCIFAFPLRRCCHEKDSRTDRNEMDKDSNGDIHSHSLTPVQEK